MNFPYKTGDEFRQICEVTQECVRAFAELSGDKGRVHEDDDFATAHGYSGRIAHGFLLGAFLSRFAGNGLPTQNVCHSVNLAWTKPVYAGDKLELVATVETAAEAVGAVTFALSFLREKTLVARGKMQVGVLA